MLDLFGNDTPYKDPRKRISPGTRNKDGSWKFNPMTLAHGETEGERCKNCVHFIRKHYAKVYFKCAIRPDGAGHSPASDQRANWTACGKFEPAQND